MPGKITPVLVPIDKDKDGNTYAVPMRRMFREARDNARAKRKPAPLERATIDAAEGKRERRRERNLSHA